MREISQEKALAMLASECSRAEHCSGEMMQKMEKWGLPADARQRVLDRLTGDRYVDDRRYASLFVRDKLKFNKRGRRKIAQAMRQKRIASDIQAEALADISDDDCAEVLAPLLKAKARTIKAGSDYERKMKLVRYALGRGFGMQEINRCLGGGAAEDAGDYDC